MNTIIEEAFKNFIALLHQRESKPKNISSIYNYLLSNGASFEKWLQFEFSNQLNHICDRMSPRYSVHPEIQKFDIVFLQEGTGSPASVIEIKHIANWGTSEVSLVRIDNDINKLREHRIFIPKKYCLVFCISATPQSGKLKWMEDHFLNTEGTITDREAFLLKIKNRFLQKNCNPIVLSGFQQSPSSPFDWISLDAIYSKIE